MPRWIASAALLCSLVVVIVLVAGSGGGYTLNADFADAGQLVVGAQVQEAGRTVGSITGLSLTRSGLARVSMSLDQGGLHEGTRALIRAVGQAGVDNRFVQLIPGASSASALPSGATLPTSQTNGIVDLDSVLDAFGPQVRGSLQGLITHAAEAFAGSGSAWFNRMLRGLDPALGSLDGLGTQLATDRSELRQLVASGAVAAGAVAGRSDALQAALTGAARTFTELADARVQLADLLKRAPGFLTAASGTLARTSVAVRALDPALRQVAAASPSLTRFLGVVAPTLDRLTPSVAKLNRELPPLSGTLRGVESLAGVAIAGLTSSRAAFTALVPLLTGLREYGSDIVLGIFNGLGGLVSGPYDAVGHYAKLNFVQSVQTLFQGDLSSLLSSSALVPGLLAMRTHLDARCPGGDAPPAPDGSNPWIPSTSLCNPADDMSLSVDYPK